MSTELQRSAERLVFETMGTVVTVVAGEGSRLTDAACVGVREAFDRLDARFSLYRPESEATAVAERRLLVRHASPEYRAAYDLATQWSVDTEGAFTPHRPDGRIDLSGVVKAMAIRDAGAALDAAGITDWCLGAGGDVLAQGALSQGSQGTPWIVGLVDPDDRTKLVSQFSCSADLPAIATSGTSERGEHIWRVGSDDTFAQVSVAGPDIVTADALATAIIAGGPDMLERATRRWPIQVLAFARDGGVRASRDFLAA